MGEAMAGRKSAARAAAVAGLAAALAATPVLAGCGSGGGGTTELSGSATPSGGKGDDGSKVSQAIDDIEIDEGDMPSGDEDAPEAAELSPEDMEVASDEVAGTWQCSVCVSGGKALAASGVLSNSLFLSLGEDGTGTLSTGDEGDPGVWLTWERVDGGLSYVTCEEGSGHVAVTRSGRLKWHLDGNGDDSYTLWDASDRQIAPSAPPA